MHKLISLAQSHPRVRIASDNRAAARGGGPRLLLREALGGDSHVVSIAACVSLDMLRRIRPGRYTKVIPSLTSEVGCGVSLVCHAPEARLEDAEIVERLFASLGTIKRIAESDFEAAADLTSCAPGMLSALFRQFVAAALRHSNLNRRDARRALPTTVSRASFGNWPSETSHKQARTARYETRTLREASPR